MSLSNHHIVSRAGLILLFILSACNYPGMRPKIQELSSHKLRQTLEAQADQTPEAISSLTPATLTSPIWRNPGIHCRL